MNLRFPGAPLVVALLVLACGCNGSSSGSNNDTLPVDQCIVTDDLAIIGALVDGGIPDGGPIPPSYYAAWGATINTCGDGCIADILAEDPQCMLDCIATSELAGISDGCTLCQQEAVLCVTRNCANVCLGSDMALCEACSQENCIPRIEECTGLPHG